MNWVLRVIGLLFVTHSCFSFFVEVFRQNGYKKCTHNIYADNFYVNIIIIRTNKIGDLNGGFIGYSPMEYAETASIS